MKSGMGAGELQMAAKIACIGVAAESARLGNRLNHSRIAAATGLTRKDVRTLAGLLHSGKVAAAREISKQRTARVLHGWRTDPEFQDRRGNPLRLLVNGPGLTFHVLVKRYGGDVTPISVLNELLRSGAVGRAAGGRVAVRKNTPRVRGFGADVVADFSARLRDLGSTLVNNIESAEHPMFVGFSEIKGLSADEAALFHETFSERAASLVDGVDRWRTSQARVRAKKSSASRADGMRVGVGVYLLEQKSTPPLPPSRKPSKPVQTPGAAKASRTVRTLKS
ncbi:MAG: hypothetical protein KGJ52_08250 [Gammaproteobacteria bacterium]|nr:hypothetical protein [Gammaproteobacteria bacterium]